MIFWALSFIWIKQAYENLGIFTTIGGQLYISSVVLFLFLFITKKIQKIDKKDFKFILYIGLCDPFGYFIFESLGLRTISATLGSVILSTIPLFAAIGAFLFFKVKIKIISLLGIILSLIGVAIIVFQSGMPSVNSFLGILFMFLAVNTSVVYSFIITKIPNKYTAVNIVAYQNLIGAILFTPIILTLGFDEVVNANITFENMKPIIYLALFSTSLAFILFTSSVKIFGVVKANIFVNLIPVFTAIFAWVIRDSSLTIIKITGILIVIIGLFLSQRND